MASSTTRKSVPARRGRKKTAVNLAEKTQRRKPAAGNRAEVGESAPGDQNAPKAAGDSKDVAALQSLLEENFPPGKDDESTGNDETAATLAPELKIKAANGKSRIIKSVIGLALVIVVGLGPVLRMFQVSSVEAVINAQVVTLRAPIAGVVELADPSFVRVGETVETGAALLRIENPRVDQARWLDALRSYEMAVDERPVLAARLSYLKAARDDLQRRLAAFKSSRLQQLQSHVDEAAAEVGAVAARLAAANAERQRFSVLNRQGSLSDARFDQAVRNAAVAEADVAAAKARQKTAAVEMAAATGGVFVDDSYNDQPQSAQRLDEIEEKIATTQAQLAGHEARIGRLETVVGREAEWLGRQRSTIIDAPANGRIWEWLTAPGEQVARGQHLLRLLDCSSAIITAAVSESVYNRLSVGMPAEFRFREGGSKLPGEVVQLTGVAAAPANLAILPSALKKESYRVTVSVPDLNAGGQCHVGRTGRVIFKGLG